MVHSHRDRPYPELHRWVCLQVGIESWKPKPKKPGEWKPTQASRQLLSESWRICQQQGANEAQFDCLVNDFRLAGHKDKDWVRGRVGYLGKSDADFERAWAKEPRTYTAEERAPIWGLTHETFQRLYLHRSGCAEKTARERRRITRDRDNLRKRAKRAAEKARRVVRQNLRTALERVKERTVAKNMATVNTSSLSEVVVDARLDSELDENQQESLNPHQSNLKKRRPPPETMPPEHPESAHIPFLERVELMQRHCGLSREEAEAEARAWVCA